MKKIIFIATAVFIFTNCKQKPKTEVAKAEIPVSEKIANAHGFKHWKNISKIEFTFAEKRNWIWYPKTNVVTLKTETDTLTYNRKEIESTTLKADQAFINDKFWLLIPFQLVWDKSANISAPEKAMAPISKMQLNKITITYPNKGGYTPGDAYDIFYNDNYTIKEWIYRRGNQEETSLANTFENYQNFNGLKIALDHKKGKSDWNLKISEVSVIKE